MYNAFYAWCCLGCIGELLGLAVWLAGWFFCSQRDWACVLFTMRGQRVSVSFSVELAGYQCLAWVELAILNTDIYMIFVDND